MPKNNKDWYNWNISNWGTKWDTVDAEIAEQVGLNDDLDKNLTEIHYYFDTAWGPAREWLRRIAEIYSDIEFELEYSEGGMDFWGKLNYKDGGLVYEEEDQLSHHNWDKVDRDIMSEIIEKDLEQRDIEEIKSLEDNDLYDIAQDIMDDYANRDEYFYNIDSFIIEEIKDKIEIIIKDSKEDDSNKINMNYDNQGHEILDLEI